VTVADTPKPGRPKPIPERFEASEVHPTAHLTDEQKTWKVVKLRPARESFAVVEQQPVVVLKLHLRQRLEEADQVVLAADIFALVQALSEADRELGGGGLTLADQRAEPGAVILTLRHAVAAGAAERSAKLNEIVASAADRAELEPAEVLELLNAAAQSPSRRVNLLLAGSRTVSRCELVTVAA
jgi:hypothetical protein